MKPFADRRGVLLINAILSVTKLPDFKCRIATPADVQLYFDWANDPVTRQQSFNSEPISWENHVTWFAKKLTDVNALLLVFETETGEPIGQVRFEKQADDEVIIGVSVDAAFRGHGLASRLIADACLFCQKRWENVPISAYIKPDNLASVRSFEHAGFAKEHSSQPDRHRLVKR